MHDTASKATLENEFGTHNEDECMIKILEGGTLQETEVSAGLKLHANREFVARILEIWELMSMFVRFYRVANAKE